MSKRFLALLTLLTAGAGTLAADVVQLKDHAAVTGQILAEKRDEIVVDIGYTVLVVPRRDILKITKTDGGSEGRAAQGKGKKRAKEAELTPSPSPGPAPGAPPTEARVGLYSTALTPPPERSVRELASLLGEAVVQVRTPSGLGSGFIIDEEGYLITNFHVIEGETQISVEVFSQRGGQLERKTYKQVQIIALNKFDDMALLRIVDPAAPKFVKVLLGQSPAVGDPVFAIGSPLGLERTVTEGIISTRTRQMQGQLYLQTTAQINPGNSGGPLFNLRGEVVGVTNMKVTFGEGLGFAIPVEVVRYFLNNRDAFAYDNDNPSNAYRYLEPPKRIVKPTQAANAKP